MNRSGWILGLCLVLVVSLFTDQASAAKFILVGNTTLAEGTESFKIPKDVVNLSLVLEPVGGATSNACARVTNADDLVSVQSPCVTWTLGPITASDGTIYGPVREIRVTTSVAGSTNVFILGDTR